jgi:hypothetical protein
MAFTKYASLEVSKILDVKGSAERDASASLSKIAAFEDYRTEDGYLYARIRAISSRVNKNHDGWPSVELAGSQDIFDHHTANSESGFTVSASKDAEYGFSTFLGKPIFVDHHNSDPSRARGVIVDAKLHVEDHKTAAQKDSYYQNAPANHTPPTWVELLLEVDAKSFPKLAKAIINGSKNAKSGIDGFSMGCDVERSVCNICKNSATTPDEFCNHVRMKGAMCDYIDPETGHKTSKKSYEDCYGIKFFEISAVFDPADETALIREVRSNVKEASMNKTASEGFVPPESVQNNARRGLEMAEAGEAGDGLESATKGRAHDIASGKALSLDHVKRMHSFFERHDKTRPDDGGKGNSPWKTAWMLWGGDSGRSWAESVVGKEIGHDKSEKISMSKFGPISEYDKYFGGTGAAKKAYDSMIDQYGEKKGKEVFYATMNKKKNKTAFIDDNKPQNTKTRAPEDVDTLREDTICDICGSTMDGPQCDVCGYEEEPKGFNDPNLDAAKKHDEEETNEETFSNLDVDTNNLPTVAHVTDTEESKTDSKVSQINKIEKPILPVQGPPASNEPKDHVVKDQKAPVTSSSVRTASDFLAAAGNRKRNNMETHIADAMTSAPAVAKPDYSTEVEGVGGVGGASNEDASKADAQVNVTEIGGVSGVGTGDEKTVEVDQGDEHSKNIEVIHTDTFHGDKGDSLGQQDPVTDVSSYQVFNSDSATPLKHHEEPAKKSSWVVSDVKGTEPSDPMGKAQDRIDVSHGDAHSITTQDSGPTKTWTGTEGNGVTRQADPVDSKDESFYHEQNSKEFYPTGVSDKDYAFGDKNSHLMTAFKLADTEIELGLLDASQKYQRVAELEKAAPSIVEASLEYASRVKTAGLKKSARTARRLPSLVREASTAPESTQTDSDDSALFM